MPFTVLDRPRRMSRSVLVTLVAGLLALAGPLAPAGGGDIAWAQTALDVERALANTDLAIERARGLIRCGPDDARLECVYLEQAEALQRSARNSFAGGFLRDALALTLRARDRAYSAVRVAQDATRGEFVRFSIERTDAMLDRIAPVVRAAGQEPALRLLEVALELQTRARRFAADGQPRAALSATSQARERGFRALQLADGAAQRDPLRARALLERSEDLLRDGAWLAGVEASAALYQRAVALQERAWRRLEAGAPGRAVEQSLRARQELRRAHERADRPIERAHVEQALRANAEALAEARPGVAGRPAVQAALEQAETLHRRAQAHYEAGRLAQAMAELRASERARARIPRP